MRRICICLSALLLIAASACEDWNNPDDPSGGGSGKNSNAEISDIAFGPLNEDALEYLSPKEYDHVMKYGPSVNEMSPMSDSTQLVMVSQYLSDNPNGDVSESDMYNKLPYAEAVQLLYILPLPEDCAVTGFKVESSDPDVIEIADDIQTFNSIGIRTRKCGFCNLEVSLSGPRNTVKKRYPVKVINRVDMRFYITPYWLDFYGYRYSRIRWKPVGFTDKEHTIVKMRDSVTVIGYCEYYDVLLTGRTPHVKRDTIRLPMREHYENMRWGMRKLLRDITAPVQYFRFFKVERGRMMEGYSIIPCFYHYIVEQVIVDYDVVSEDNMFEFTTSLRMGGKWKWKTLVKCNSSKEENDPLNGVPIGEDDDRSEEEKNEPENVDDGVDGDTENDSEFERRDVNYFTVQINDFLSNRQRDSVGRAISDFKREQGYDKDLTPEQLDSALNVVNKFERGGSDSDRRNTRKRK